jgi:hypothetical protein
MKNLEHERGRDLVDCIVGPFHPQSSRYSDRLAIMQSLTEISRLADEARVLLEWRTSCDPDDWEDNLLQAKIALRSLQREYDAILPNVAGQVSPDAQREGIIENSEDEKLAETLITKVVSDIERIEELERENETLKNAIADFCNQPWIQSSDCWKSQPAVKRLFDLSNGGDHR